MASAANINSLSPNPAIKIEDGEATAYTVTATAVNGIITLYFEDETLSNAFSSALTAQGIPCLDLNACIHLAMVRQN